MIASNVTEYADGSYSATSIEYAQMEGDSCSRVLAEVNSGKAKFIGELKCFDNDGKLQIHKNLGK